METIKLEYEQHIKNTYAEAGKTIVKEIDISTLFNASRELYASSESLIASLKEYLLDDEHAKQFDDNALPFSTPQ